MKKPQNRAVSRTSDFKLDNVADDCDNDSNKDNHGWFVTTKKAMAFMVFAVFSLIFVILFMYFYGPSRQLEEHVHQEDTDIEDIIQEDIEHKVKRNIRLPNTLRPLHYKLKLFPISDESNVDFFSFNGTVTITILCIESTKEIILNWHSLQINDEDISVYFNKKANVIPTNETNVAKPEQNFGNVSNERIENVTESEIAEYIGMSHIDKDSTNLKLTLFLNEYLNIGNIYYVEIKFSGTVSDNLVGLYKTSYIDGKGKKQWLLTTQFYTIYARRVFPCFDEPHFKAQFQISLARKTNLVALSNMPLENSEPLFNKSDWVLDHFQTSPPMSTYMVAFTICPFGRLEKNTTNMKTKVAILAPRAELSKVQYALDIALEVIKFLEKYFNCKYPLPKLDLLAIPNFEKEAMENWGLISLRKSSLLFSNSDSILLRPYIFHIITHQLILQWLGNLVTPAWWTDMWLKEAFASYISAVVVKELRPQWRTEQNFPLLNLHRALYLDSLKSARSIKREIDDNGQIEQIMDAVVYSKGSTLLRMLSFIMTPNVFKLGIRRYINGEAYNSVNEIVFWEYLTAAANDTQFPTNLTLATVTKSWTELVGYPCITITQDVNDVIVTQERFTRSNITNVAQIWNIPLSFITKTNDVFQKIWLTTKEAKFENVSKNNSWILFNINQSGFYRVNYDVNNWKFLRKQLEKNFRKIPMANRAQIMDDSFELARFGKINYSIPFGLTIYLRKNETRYLPWASALKNLKYIRIIMDNYEYSGVYDKYLTYLIAERFNILTTRGRSDESLSNKLLRLEMIELACKLHYEPCTQWAVAQFQNWVKQQSPDQDNPISKDYRYIVQCKGIHKGGRSDWNFLWQRTLSPTVSPKDLKIMYLSLGCTHDPWLLNRYLHLSMSGNISLENVPLVWKSINHPVGLRIGFPFLRLNWNRIYKLYRDMFGIYSVIISEFLSSLSTEIDLEDLTQFYKIHQEDLQPYARLMQETVDKIKLRIEWKEKHLDYVVSWLQNDADQF